MDHLSYLQANTEGNKQGAEQQCRAPCYLCQKDTCLRVHRTSLGGRHKNCDSNFLWPWGGRTGIDHKQDFIKQTSPYQSAQKHHCIFLYEGNMVWLPPTPQRHLFSSCFVPTKQTSQSTVYCFHLSSLPATGGYGVVKAKKRKQGL